MKVQFGEESYSNDDGSTFGIMPNAAIVEFKNYIDLSSNILDIGCGDGKNSLYLASLGFQSINAFDISENAIAKLQRIANRKKFAIKSWVQDLRKYSFDCKYDLIMSFGTLHFVEKEAWKKLLVEAKKNTNTGGIHIIQLFTNTLPATPDIETYAIGMADDGELEFMYADWHIIQFKSYIFEDVHPGIPKHYHASNKIIAQKCI